MLPVLTDQRLRFRTLVAMNALGDRRARARRAVPTQDGLRERRGGSAPATSPGDLQELSAEVEARLAIASPGYLRDRDESRGAGST